MDNLPGRTYLKTIRFGGDDFTKAGISGTGGQLEILFSQNAADVSGVVHKEDGHLAAAVRVRIWSPNGPDLLRTANTDQNGAFPIRDLAPVEYRIAAWEDVDFRTAA